MRIICTPTTVICEDTDFYHEVSCIGAWKDILEVIDYKPQEGTVVLKTRKGTRCITWDTMLYPDAKFSDTYEILREDDGIDVNVRPNYAEVVVDNLKFVSTPATEGTIMITVTDLNNEYSLMTVAVSGDALLIQNCTFPRNTARRWELQYYLEYFCDILTNI